MLESRRERLPQPEIDVGSFLKASYPMNIYILEIRNYTGKFGFSMAWNSRFYLPEPAGQSKAGSDILQTPGTTPCVRGAEEGRGWDKGSPG